MKLALSSIVVVLIFVSYTWATTCLVASYDFGAVNWYTNDKVGVTVFSPDQIFVGCVLYKRDSNPVSGTFYVIPGTDFNTANAIASSPFSSSSSLVYGNVTLPTLTINSLYSYVWVRDFSGSTTQITLSSTSGIGTAWYNGAVDNIALQGEFCYDPFPSPSPSSSVTPSVSPSNDPSPSVTPSRSPSVSPTSSPSVTPSISVSPSVTPSHSPSITPSISVSPSVTPSHSPSVTPSISVSASVTPSPSPSVTPSPTSSPSLGSSPSVTPTRTPSHSPTSSVTPSISASASATASVTVSPSSFPTSSTSSTPSTSPSSSPSASSSSAASASASPAAVNVEDTYTDVSMNLEGDLASFDEDQFVSDMSEILGVNAATLQVVSTARKSFDVVLRIFDTNSQDSVTVANDLQQLVSSNDPILASYNIVVLSLSIDDSHAASTQQSDSSGLGTGGIVAIAVVVPVAALALIGITVFAIKKRNNGSVQGGVEMKSIEPKPIMKKVDEESGTSETSEESSDSEESETSGSEEESSEEESESSEETDDTSEEEEDSESEEDSSD